MNNLLNKFVIYIFFINILSICISENLESVQGVLNQYSPFTVSSMHSYLISYSYPICNKTFLQVKIQSELKGNEFVSIKSKSDTYELRIKNQQNLPHVIANVTICSSFQLKGCGNKETSTIELRTNAERNLLVNLHASLNKDFTINIGENRTDVSIDDYSPSYYLLKFNDKNEDMEVKINSNNDNCMHAFIEKAECSANILTPHLESVRAKTITKKGTILIKNRDEYVNNSLFLAFKLSDSCTINGTRKQFNISFQNVDTNYFSAFKPFWILVVIYCLTGIFYAIVYRIIWFYDEDGCKKIWCCSDKAKNKANGCVPCLRSGYFKCWSFEHFLPSKYVFIISIFYILPTTQLLYNYITIMDVHGNFDLCYYNDQCSKPYGSFLAFNNVISNIGFVIMGIFYIIIVSIQHHCRHRCISSEKDFISPNYGIFYALGLSLIMEGIVSGIYHICPRSNTIQFDLIFMYIIGCLLNLYYAIQIMTIFETHDNTITVRSTLNNDDNNQGNNTGTNNQNVSIGTNNQGNNTRTNNQGNNTRTNNQGNNTRSNNQDNNTVIIESKYKSRPNVSENYTVKIDSKNDYMKINFEDNVEDIPRRNNVITKYHNIKIKEMFFYMSFVMFALILILIFAEDNSKKVWIVVGCIQLIVIVLYCCRIFCFCKSDTSTLCCRITCIVFIILTNVIIFLVGLFEEWAFYLYFLVVIIGNSAILAIEYYCIIFMCKDVTRKCPPTCLTTCPPTCLTTCPPTCLTTCPPTCLPTCPPNCLPTCPPTCLPTCPPTCPPNCPPTCLPTCPPTCPPTCCQSICERICQCCSLKMLFIILNLLFAVIFIRFAMVSFIQAPTEWNKPASHSREINQDCIWWNFYDIHDKWHFLASIAVFLVYMSILLLDNWIYEEKKEENQTIMDSSVNEEKKEKNQTIMDSSVNEEKKEKNQMDIVTNIVKPFACFVFLGSGFGLMVFLFI